MDSRTPSSAVWRRLWGDLLGRAGVGRVTAALLTGAVLLATGALPSSAAPAWARSSVNSEGTSQLELGQELLSRADYEGALRAFRNALRGGEAPSADILLGVAEAQRGLGHHQEVIKVAERLLAVAGDDTALRVRTHNMKGVALTAQAGPNDHKRLAAAEREFRQALELAADNWRVALNLGVVLLRQGRDEEGVGLLRTLLGPAGGSPESHRIRRFIENPRRAREPYAPEFSLVTRDGEEHSLGSLRGKVVLLDFWGTWCPPCVEALPGLTRLHNRYTDQPFVLLGISSDHDEDRWRDFVEERGLKWPQHLDRDAGIQRLFEVDGFPTYIVLDPEGIIRYRGVGGGGQSLSRLDSEIREELKRWAGARKQEAR